jgi:hypothetical protein
MILTCGHKGNLNIVEKEVFCEHLDQSGISIEQNWKFLTLSEQKPKEEVGDEKAIILAQSMTVDTLSLFSKNDNNFNNTV